MDKKIQVALAEDEPYLRESLVRYLQKSTRIDLVCSAGDGDTIVKLSAQLQPDVILMDIEMERYDAGIQAAAAISWERPETIFIFLTVHDEDDLVYRAFSSALNVDYIIKSASYLEIEQKVVDAYHGRNSVDPQIMRKLTQEFGRMKRQENSMLYFINLLFAVTPSEKELIGMFLNGKTVTEIAQHRVVEVSTVKSQVNTLLKKFHLRRTREIVLMIDNLNLRGLFH